MSDNFQITAGSGTTIGADEVVDGTLGTVKTQFIKLMDGTLDSTNKLSVSSSGAAKVDGSAVTQPISATSLPLPSGASTEATLAAIKAKTDNLDVLLSTRNKPSDVIQTTMQSGASSDLQTVDPVSKAARVSLYDTTGRDVSCQSKQTFSCTTAGFTPAATATDLFRITGSATKTIRIIDLRIGGTATAATIIDSFVIKHSTNDTAGTFVAGTVVPHDSNNSAATVTIGHYTANPTLGTVVGTILRKKVLLPISTTAANDVNISLAPTGGQTLLDQPIVLRGATQELVVNNNGAAIPTGGANWYVVCTWIEE